MAGNSICIYFFNVKFSDIISVYVSVFYQYFPLILTAIALITVDILVVIIMVLNFHTIPSLNHTNHHNVHHQSCVFITHQHHHHHHHHHNNNNHHHHHYYHASLLSVCQDILRNLYNLARCR